tara:strand:+ start:92 stop:787 length:696 start_codon:yes stop_codon:yes gene_type:complete
MILTAHQPLFLPYLGHFAKIAESDVFVYLDTVSYSKWSWNSRNKIRTPDGWLWLVVPVLTHGHHNQTLNQIKIDNSQKWRKKHIKAIEMSYSKAPYFETYIDFFRDIYEKEWTYLSDFNEKLIHFFIKELGIDVEFVKASSLPFSLEGEKSDLVLDLCKKMKADVFIFGETGKTYAKVEDFESSGIKIIFQDYKHPKYTQVHENFVPNMSIIDLLFNCGPKSLEILMGNSN